MSYIGLPFWVLCGLTLLIYFIWPKKTRWCVLLFFSILFYCTWSVTMLPYVILSVVTVYGCARGIEKLNLRTEEQLKGVTDQEAIKTLRQKTRRKCKYILWLGVVIVVGLLVFTKVYRLFMKSFLAPIGISYYTLSLIGYLADVYWRKIKEPETNILKVALFALYFPKILQGPICRFQNIAKDLFTAHTFEYERFCFGLQLMVWGYFKKMVIADRLNLFVSGVYGNYANSSGSMFILATFLGAFQLYCDFSGCMNIAEGFSEILGITLEKNFNHPFFSETASEFWRRWHITLGTWFKDYIYMPMVVSPRLIKLSGRVKKIAGKRAGKAVMTIIPLVCVWLLTGLWHGTGRNYVVWGIFWGGIIIVSTIWAPEIQKINKLLHIKEDSACWHFIRKLRTFLLFVFTRFITIPSELRITKEAFYAIVTRLNLWELFDGGIYRVTASFNRQNYYLALCSLVLLGVVSVVEEKYGSVRRLIANWQIVFRWLCYLALLFSVIIFGIYGPGYDAGTFVYMQY